MAADVFRATVHFSGRVQGVGFRFQTLQVAHEYTVAGQVRNLPDGRVQLEAEGTEAEVNDFVKAVEDRMEGYIRKVERTSVRGPAAHQGFTIR